MNTAYKELGQSIRQIRSERSESVETFARNSHNNVNALRRTESGERQKPGTIEFVVNNIINNEDLNISQEKKKRMLDLLEETKIELNTEKKIKVDQMTSLMHKVDTLSDTFNQLNGYIKEHKLLFTSLDSDSQEEKDAKNKLMMVIDNYRAVLGSEDLHPFRDDARKEIDDFTAKMAEMRSGRRLLRQYSTERLDETWSSIIYQARKGDIIFTTSIVPLKWWEANRDYLETNRSIIEDGRQIVRIFILNNDDIETINLGDSEKLLIDLPKSNWREEMKKHVAIGVQVNWVSVQNIKKRARDFLCANVSLQGNLHDIDNSLKRITDIQVAGEEIPQEGKVEWSQLVKTTNSNDLRDIREHLDEYYRKSVRFISPEWYLDFYNESYFRIDKRREDGKNEAELIRNLILKYLPERSLTSSTPINILDLGCGYGRCANPLKESDPRFNVWGVDSSLYMLNYAKQEASDQTNARIHYEYLDLKDLRKFVARKNQLQKNLKEYFDAAISIYTSFGYLSDTENAEIINQVALTLKPGGLLLLDLDDKEYFIKNEKTPKIPYCENDEWQTCRYDFYDRVSKRRISQYVIKDKNKKGKIKPMPLFVTRLYDADEISFFLQRFNLKKIGCWRDFTEGQYRAGQSERLIILTRKEMGDTSKVKQK